MGRSIILEQIHSIVSSGTRKIALSSIGSEGNKQIFFPRIGSDDEADGSAPIQTGAR
jgi:hypothetical protein